MNSFIQWSLLRFFSHITCLWITSVCIVIQVHIIDIVKPYRVMQSITWRVRIEAGMALLELEFYYKGVDASLTLYFSFLNEEPSFRGLFSSVSIFWVSLVLLLSCLKIGNCWNAHFEVFYLNNPKQKLSCNVFLFFLMKVKINLKHSKGENCTNSRHQPPGDKEKKS